MCAKQLQKGQRVMLVYLFHARIMSHSDSGGKPSDGTVTGGTNFLTSLHTDLAGFGKCKHSTLSI